ncbi:MAG: DUF302 domain-containing protein [Thermoanaerobaculales bacterium]|jgi:uncharacterized protein (DUF302 family)|nr:DUF302 domain-containing protein [Thermoanaerobaculales bacterium]
MSYYISRKLKMSIDDAEGITRDALAKEGFGVLTEIDVRGTLKKKLDVDFPPYRILGACNPPFALKALQSEPRVGTMLPCNVILRELSKTEVEISAIDPVSSMQSIDNPSLVQIAGEIRDKLKRVLDSL